ncbi:MAG: protease pro-enzyme activation domain-containing protein [Acidobacteriaceae bacterium]|nr:protease pro-enzyme activation domain-containing protein [Acidobacteriaceae bacterium]
MPSLAVRRPLRSLFAAFAAFSLLPLSLSASAQTADLVARSARVKGSVNDAQRSPLANHVPGYAKSEALPSTTLSGTKNFTHLTVVLSRSADVQAAFEQLLADQANPSSPRYHQWLTPQQVGTLYGPAQVDVDAVTEWLKAEGLTVESVAPNRLFISFGGSVTAVSKAFSTSFRTFALANGESRYSLVSEPTVPTAIAGVVQNVAGLSQSIHHPNVHRSDLIQADSSSSSAGTGSHLPSLNSSTGAHYLVSGDFAVAYDLNSVYNSGYTGTGQRVAIVGESRVDTTDIKALQSIQGFTTYNLPNVVIPPTGVDPGYGGGSTACTSNCTIDSGVQDEATLDVNRVTGTAPGATVDLVISGDVGSGSTVATDGLFIAINHEINTLADPIMSISFGGCENLNGSSLTNYEASIFSTAAAEGISTFVSSGDSGAAGCNAFANSDQSIPASGQVLSINDFCSSQYVTCIGGTQFADTASPTTYWSTSSGTNYVSLKSYIPEGAWNEPSVTKSIYYQGATGGGLSVYIAKPSWQTGTGVLAGNFREVPDLAFTASVHDGFVTCLEYLGATCGSFYGFGGTSAAAPSMAGIQALVNQRLTKAQGNINPQLYTLANGTSASTVFHDATVTSSGVSGCVVTTPSLCNNSTPSRTALTGGLSGYLLTAGWDGSTGWGSLDVANYISALAASAGITTTTALTAAPTTLTLGGSTVLTATITPSTTSSSTLSGTVTFSNGSTTLGTGTVTNNVATYTYTPAATGTYSITATYGGDTTFSSSTSSAASVVVSGPYLITPASTSVSVAAGVTTTDAITVTSIAPFAGSVPLSCAVSTSSTSTGGSCSVTSPVTLTSGGTAAATLSIKGGTTGSMTVTVSGTSTAGTITSTPITVTVTPALTLTASPSSLSFTSGATTGNTSTITLTPASGVAAGTATLQCSITTSTAAYPASCALSSTSVALAAGGTGTTVLTIGSQTATTSASKSATTATAGFSGFRFAALGLLFASLLAFRKRRGLASLAVFGLLALGLSTLTGCGGDNAPKTTKSSAGSYTATVTATFGGQTASTTVAVTIQ